MAESPIEKLKQWWQAALDKSPLQQKSAVCVSTINQDGFPDGRFVDLKQVDSDGLVFCTYLDSQKGRDIQNNNKVALTAWWDHIGYQIRVTGRAQTIDEQLALAFWQSRSRSAQLTTSCFQQSQVISGGGEITQQFNEFSQLHQEAVIAKPGNWGGYRILPDTIEFLTFKESRLHLREKFTYFDNVWQKQYLQP